MSKLQFDEGLEMFALPTPSIATWLCVVVLVIIIAGLVGMFL